MAATPPLSSSGEACKYKTTDAEIRWMDYLASVDHLQAGERLPWVNFWETGAVSRDVFVLTSWAFIASPPKPSLRQVLEVIKEDYLLMDANEHLKYGYKVVKILPRSAAETEDCRLLYVEGLPVCVRRKATLSICEIVKIFDARNRAGFGGSSNKCVLRRPLRQI